MITLRPEPRVDVRWGCEQLSAVVSTLLTSARQRPEQLPTLLSSALMYAGYVAVSDSDSPELDRALRVASQAGAALFRLAGADGAVEITIGDLDPVLLPATPSPQADAETFRIAFLVATVCRDSPSLAILAGVPLAQLRPDDTEPCVMLRNRALQAAWRRQPEAATAIDAALHAADPGRLRAIAPEQVRWEVVPELEALRAIVHGDTLAFNRALERVLDGHRRLRAEGDGRDDPRHFLALGALGLASLACEAGLRIDGQSDYTPLRLVHGDLDRASWSVSGTIQFDEEGEQPGSLRFVLCRFCATPINRRTRACPGCGSDVSHTEPLEYEVHELAMVGRTPCIACGETILKVATVCPRCRTWQTPGGADDAATDEVALRVFPPEYQIHVMTRTYEPSRMAVLLPGDVPHDSEVIDRLRHAGVEVLTAGPARYPEDPEAPWELDLEVRCPGEDGVIGTSAIQVQIWPAPIGALPGFDRGALGPGVIPGDHALVVMARWGRDLLRDLHAQLKVAAAVAPEGVGIVEVEAHRVRTAAWLLETAASPVPPDPAELYAIEVVRTVPDGGGPAGRAWIHTRGLVRCGCFELEMLDVPADRAERFAVLLDAAARRLVEVGDTVPPEEQPFAVGELTLAWAPSPWARDELESDAIGAMQQGRGDYFAVSAALLAANEGGTAPIATLTAALAGNPRLYESTLDAERDRLTAHATLRRFQALRRAHPRDDAWQFLVRLRLEDDAGTSWARLQELHGAELEVTLLGEPPPGLAKGQRGRWPVEALLDWEIECPEGRITPSDALAELLQARRSDLQRMQTERGRTPVLIERSSAVTMEPQSSFTDAELRAGLLGEDTAPGVPEPTTAGLPGPDRRVAVALSLLVPGAGHLYLGRRRGWTWLGGAVLTAGLCGLVNLAAAYDVWTNEA